jgi:phosphomannomutase
MEKSIFKAYDIRGIYPSDLNEETAKFIAQAFVNFLSKKLNKKSTDLKIVLGRDIRKASGGLSEAIIKVFLDNGLMIDNLDLISTNDYFFALGKYDYDGGIMVTASHNPPAYGGFKMAYKQNDDFHFISGKDLLSEVEKISELKSFDLAGQELAKNIFADHLKHVLSFVDLQNIKPLKIVVDTGNGMNVLMMEKILEVLPCKVTPLFFELDSNFPNRPPNPLAENATEKIAAKIKEVQADLGLMFDVDGDRMFLVDEQGNLLRGDVTILLLAKVLLAKYPGAGIAYNLICSHSVKDLITAWGGKPIRSEVGYMNLARHMKESGGVMSGEVSGHFAFKDNFYSDNAFIAMLLALEAISLDTRKVSEIAKDFVLYHKNEELNLSVADIPSALAKIRKCYQENILDEIDGITVEFDSWWFNVRASNTEPLLRITVEANTPDLLKEKTEELRQIIGA